MARLNWEKLARQSRAQNHRDGTSYDAHYLTDQHFEATNRWSAPGKYRGTPLDQLPIKYLFWILDNFREGKHRQRAEGEIYRRYHELSDTQG